MKEYIAFGVGMMLALACIMLLENIEEERFGTMHWERE